MPTRKTHPLNSTDEANFLAQYDAAQYNHPSVAVDIVLLTLEEQSLHTMLLQRDQHPARDHWALPGGFVGMDESVDTAAHRVLRQKANLNDVFIEQLYTFGDLGRDPRTRVISISYFALVAPEILRKAIADSPSRSLMLAKVIVPWSGETGGPAQAVNESRSTLSLAFDHADILGMAIKRLRGRLNYSPIAFELLPAEFTLRALQNVHETILGRTLNKDAFRRRMLASGDLQATGRFQDQVDHRPAELYRYCAHQ